MSHLSQPLKSELSLLPKSSFKFWFIDPKNHSKVIKLTNSKVEFGLVPTEHWNQPQWINETKPSLARQRLLKDGVPYGGEFRLLLLCSVKLFIKLTLHREPFVRSFLSWIKSWILMYKWRYRNMCRFFAGVMFLSKTLSSNTLDLTKYLIFGIVLV